MSEPIRLTEAIPRARPPKPEEVQLRFSKNAVLELEALKPHYPDLKSLILPALWIAQREYGWLPPEAIAEVALRLKRSYAEVEGVATFYTMYDTEHKPGRHKIEVCTCLTCQVCGAYRLAEYLKAKLGVEFGGTTPDGEFTLEEVECLDACDRAPVLQVGDQYHGPVDEAFVDRMLEKLRSEPESTALRLADEVVGAHFSSSERPT